MINRRLPDHKSQICHSHTAPVCRFWRRMSLIPGAQLGDPFVDRRDNNLSWLSSHEVECQIRVAFHETLPSETIAVGPALARSIPLRGRIPFRFRSASTQLRPRPSPVISRHPNSSSHPCRRSISSLLGRIPRHLKFSPHSSFRQGRSPPLDAAAGLKRVWPSNGASPEFSHETSNTARQRPVLPSQCACQTVYELP
jgi:hypothetical protein